MEPNISSLSIKDIDKKLNQYIRQQNKQGIREIQNENLQTIEDIKKKLIKTQPQSEEFKNYTQLLVKLINTRDYVQNEIDQLNTRGINYEKKEDSEENDSEEEEESKEYNESESGGDERKEETEEGSEKNKKIQEEDSEDDDYDEIEDIDEKTDQENRGIFRKKKSSILLLLKTLEEDQEMKLNENQAKVEEKNKKNKRKGDGGGGAKVKFQGKKQQTKQANKAYRVLSMNSNTKTQIIPHGFMRYINNAGEEDETVEESSDLEEQKAIVNKKQILKRNKSSVDLMSSKKHRAAIKTGSYIELDENCDDEIGKATKSNLGVPVGDNNNSMGLTMGMGLGLMMGVGLDEQMSHFNNPNNPNSTSINGKVFNYIKILLNSKSKIIDLRNYYLTSEECYQIQLLLANRTFIKTIYINSYQIGSSGLSSLGNLCSFNKNIKKIKIKKFKNSINFIKTQNSFLKRLKIDSYGIKSFMKNISYSSISDLDLSGNDLTDHIILPIFNQLLISNQIRSLNISNNNLSELSCKRIQFILMKNNSLVHLKMNKIKFTQEDVLLIFQSFLYNRTLQSLSIDCISPFNLKFINKIIEFIQLDLNLIQLKMNQIEVSAASSSAALNYPFQQQQGVSAYLSYSNQQNDPSDDYPVEQITYIPLHEQFRKLIDSVLVKHKEMNELIERNNDLLIKNQDNLNIQKYLIKKLNNHPNNILLSSNAALSPSSATTPTTSPLGNPPLSPGTSNSPPTSLLSSTTSNSPPSTLDINESDANQQASNNVSDSANSTSQISQQGSESNNGAVITPNNEEEEEKEEIKMLKNEYNQYKVIKQKLILNNIKIIYSNVCNKYINYYNINHPSYLISSTSSNSSSNSLSSLSSSGGNFSSQPSSTSNNPSNNATNGNNPNLSSSSPSSPSLSNSMDRNNSINGIDYLLNMNVNNTDLPAFSNGLSIYLSNLQLQSLNFTDYYLHYDAPINCSSPLHPVSSSSVSGSGKSKSNQSNKAYLIKSTTRNISQPNLTKNAQQQTLSNSSLNPSEPTNQQQVSFGPAAGGDIKDITKRNSSGNVNNKDYEIIQKLTELILINNQIKSLSTEKLISRYQIFKLYYLDLSCNQFDRFPIEICNYCSHTLEYLNLSFNEISSLPQEVGQLKKLKKLILANNKIAEIPECFNQLSHLIELDCSKNEIKQLPVNFSIKSLEYFSISFNKLICLPDSIGEMLYLRILLINNNNINYLPLPLHNIILQLFWFDVSNNPLLTIPPSIILSTSAIYHYLKQLENGSEDYSNIKLLILSSSKSGKSKFLKLLFNTPSHHTTSLNSLLNYTSSSSHSHAHSSSSPIPSSGYLNTFSAFSSPSHSASNLSSSSLDMGKLPSISGSSNTSKSKIKREPSKKYLPIIKKISFSKNNQAQSEQAHNESSGSPTESESNTERSTDKKPSPVVELKSQKSMMSLLKRDSAKKVKEKSKSDGVGEGTVHPLANMANITTLQPGAIQVNSSLFPSAGYSSSDAIQRSPRDAGMKRSSSNTTDDEKKNTEEQGKGYFCNIGINEWCYENIKFNSWNFQGNKDVIYRTHQFFTTDNSIYLICFNISKDIDNIDNLIQSILSLRDCKSPILFIGLVKERINNKKQFILNTFQRIMIKYKDRFSSIVSFISISIYKNQKSSSKNKGIKELKLKLIEIAKLKGLIHQKLPSTYVLLMNDLKKKYEEKRINSLPPILSWKEFNEIGKSLHVPESNLTEAAEFLHRIGSIIYFSDNSDINSIRNRSFSDQSSLNDANKAHNEYSDGYYLLKYTIFLDPQWLIEAFSCILTLKNFILSNGRLSSSLLATIWLAPKFPLQVHSLLISLFQKFEILYPVASFSPSIVNSVSSLLPLDKSSAPSPSSSIPANINNLSPIPSPTISNSNSLCDIISDHSSPHSPSPSTSNPSLSSIHTVLNQAPSTPPLSPTQSSVDPAKPPGSTLEHLPSPTTSSDTTIDKSIELNINIDKIHKQSPPSSRIIDNNPQQLNINSPKSPSSQNFNQDIIIPSLLPIDRPTDIINIWPLFEDDMQTITRIWEFKCLPTNFFPKLIARTCYLPYITIHSIWRNGMVLLHNTMSDNKALIEYNPSLFRLQLKLRLSQNKNNSITAEQQQQENKKKYNFIILLLDSINIFIQGWFKSQLENTLITCVHCINEHSFDPFMFLLSDCEISAARGKRYTHCRGIRPIRIDLLAPDVALSDIQHLNYKELVMKEELGEGSFARVYRGEYNHHEVAIKLIKLQNEDTEVKESDEELRSRFNEFRREVSLMSGLDHPNLVELIGLCLESNSMLMVTEFLKYGDLYSFLHKPENVIDWPLRLKIAHDVALGMNFLHTAVPKIIHRDLKSPNILLANNHVDSNQDIVAKVADFGLSSSIFHTATGREVFNPMWLAPEMMTKGQPEYTEKADIYSYAIILWELITRAIPFEEYNYTFHSLLEEDIINRQLRPTIPSHTPPLYAKLITDCWQANPQKRPSFTEILKKLSTIQLELAPELTKKKRAVKKEIQTQPARVSSLFIDKKQFDDSNENNKLSPRNVVSYTHSPLVPSHSGSIKTMLIVNNHIWVGCGDGVIFVWSKSSRQLITELKFDGGGEKMAINSLILVDGLVWSATNIRKSSINIWNPTDFSLVRKISADIYGTLLLVGRNIWCATIHTKNQSNVIHIRSSKGKKRIKKQLTLLDAPAECLLENNDQVWIGSSAHIIVINKQTYSRDAVLVGHTGTVHGLVKVGNHVWSCSTDKTIRVWDCYGNCLHKLEGHGSRVFSLLHHNNKIWSGSWDKTIMIWDPINFCFIQELKNIHEDAISAMISVNIGPSISELWSGSWDRSVNVLSEPFNFDDENANASEVPVAVQLREPTTQTNENKTQKLLNRRSLSKRSSSVIFSKLNMKKL